LGVPPQTLAIRESQNLAILYPKLQRAEIYSLDASTRGALGDALALLEAGFPKSREELEQRFEIESLDPVKDVDMNVDRVWRMTLAPRFSEARRLITRVIVEFESTRAGPRAIELRFADGATLRNDFSASEANGPMTDELFQVLVPEGFKITRQPAAP
jgi:hypothetical protein